MHQQRIQSGNRDEKAWGGIRKPKNTHKNNRRRTSQTEENNAVLRKKNVTMEKNFGSIFTKDQMKAIGMKSKRGIRWSKNTLKKAIQLCFSVSSTGYRLL
ncbi:hypothetical protein GOODEAATRI_033717 [Goodea atripinnis]|uniref:Nuclease associated modular domain-containing protein n=1 Tax=Goodea atripinnis TaxID=208336 RepID=A0ABV0NFW4_9TELE